MQQRRDLSLLVHGVRSWSYTINIETFITHSGPVQNNNNNNDNDDNKCKDAIIEYHLKTIVQNGTQGISLCSPYVLKSKKCSAPTKSYDFEQFIMCESFA